MNDDTINIFRAMRYSAMRSNCELIIQTSSSTVIGKPVDMETVQEFMDKFDEEDSIIPNNNVEALIAMMIKGSEKIEKNSGQPIGIWLKDISIPSEKMNLEFMLIPYEGIVGISLASFDD